jgi:hypothetical protein
MSIDSLVNWCRDSIRDVGLYFLKRDIKQTVKSYFNHEGGMATQDTLNGDISNVCEAILKDSSWLKNQFSEDVKAEITGKTLMGYLEKKRAKAEVALLKLVNSDSSLSKTNDDLLILARKSDTLYGKFLTEEERTHIINKRITLDKRNAQLKAQRALVEAKINEEKLKSRCYACGLESFYEIQIEGEGYSYAEQLAIIAKFPVAQEKYQGSPLTKEQMQGYLKK